MITYELDSLQDSFLEITFEEGQFAGQKLRFDEFDTCGVATCSCYNLHVMKGDRAFIFEAELTDEVWDELFEKFTFLKGVECDLIPISEVVHNFTETQYKEVLGEAVMFYYDDVFPHSMDFKVTVDDVDYLLLDLYCLVPSCDCHEVILQVMDSEYEDSLFSVIHDVKQKTFKLDKETEVKASKEKVQAILEAIRNQFTEAKIKGISYADRYKRMRAVFKDFLVRKGIPQHYHPETRLVATIGRNDNCSCGSGKKYKKCCGK
jgi:uncharacterized protein YchJ